MCECKTKDEIEIMRRAGNVVARTLDMVGELNLEGMSTGELDRLIEEHIREQGAVPGFKGYHGFPASACISIDNEVVHGIPGKRIMKSGEIVSVDIGSIVDEFYGDSARTFAIGDISDEKKLLMEWTEKSLMAGVDKARKDNKLGEISSTIQLTAEGQGYGVVRRLVGHGIGRKLHESPQVPNFGSPSDGPILKPGMVLAIEPMVNLGSEEVKTMPDGWTEITIDGRSSAHYEHTVVITEGDPDILTLV